MKALSDSEARKWCVSNRIDASTKDGPVAPNGLRLFRLPNDQEQRGHVSTALMDHFGTRPCLAWITNWDIWSGESRRDLFEAFCHQRTLPSVLFDWPAFLFRRHESADAAELVGICAMSLWDVDVIGVKGKPYLYLSHDEIGGASFSLPEPVAHLAL